MPRGNQLRKRDQAIAALISTSTIADAARQVPMGVRTLKRWLAQDDFHEAYQTAQRRLIEAAVNKLRTVATVFVSTLESVATNTEAPPAARATAARSGLEVLLKAAGMEQLEDRVAELEENMRNRQD